MSEAKICYISNVDLGGMSGQHAFSRGVLSTLIKSGRLNVRSISPFGDPPRDLTYQHSTIFKTSSFKVLKLLMYQVALCYFIFLNREKWFVFSFKIHMVSAILLVLLRCKYVVLMEGHTKKNLQSRYHVFLVRFLLKFLGIILLNSRGVTVAYKSAADWLYRDYAIRASIVLCSSDLAFQSSTNKTFNKSVDLVFVGSFREVHRVPALLALCSKYDLSCVLIGEGEEKELCEKLVKQSKMQNVEFVGFLEGSELIAQVSRARFGWGFIAPDHWGLPMKVFDYMACGVVPLTLERSDFEIFKELGWLISFNERESQDLELIAETMSASFHRPDPKRYSNSFGWNLYEQAICRIIFS
jgi:glycosyltransferase involved in cell wall biosynthesis